MCTSLVGLPAESRPCPGTLAANAELLQERQVRLAVTTSDILQEAAALAYHANQSAAGSHVLFTTLEVRRQFLDAFAEYGNLSGSRAGVFAVQLNT